MTTTAPKTHPYAPERLDYWLRRWELLDGLVSSPRTSMHHLTRQHEKTASDLKSKNACPNPDSSIGWKHSEMWAEFRADIISAARRLQGLQAATVEAVSYGRSLNDCAKRLGKNKAKVLGSYSEALITMATSLGWEEPADLEPDLADPTIDAKESDSCCD